MIKLNKSQKKDKMNFKEIFKKLWLNFKKLIDYAWNGDSLMSYVVFFALAIFFIKIILMPSLGLIFKNDFPVVAIVTGSMEHKIVNGAICDKRNYQEDMTLNFDEWWNLCGNYYQDELKISKEEFEEFEYKNGLNIGDVMVLSGWKNKENIQIGDVLVFVPGDLNWYNSHGPVIHRVVEIEEKNSTLYFTTKGDHNIQVIKNNNFEEKISEEQVIGTPILRIPYLGLFKVYLNKILGIFI